MKVALGNDHNGAHVKDQIIEFLKSKNIEVIVPINENDPLDDFPDYAFAVGEAVANKEADYGILLCGTGIGMCIAANKVKGITCAHVTNSEDAILSKKKNHANVIALSGKRDINDILSIIDSYLTTELSNEERLIRRNNKIYNYESK